MAVRAVSTESRFAGPAGGGAAPRSAPVTTWLAMRRGLMGRCPHCGEGRLFGAFLKVVDQCEVCGEEFHHHRADDFPAYIVIVIVGHIIVPLVLYAETHFEPAYWVHLALWLPATIGLSFALMPPVKGAIVALQWAVGMHGFDEARKRRTLPAQSLSGE